MPGIYFRNTNLHAGLFHRPDGTVVELQHIRIIWIMVKDAMVDSVQHRNPLTSSSRLENVLCFATL